MRVCNTVNGLRRLRKGLSVGHFGRNNEGPRLALSTFFRETQTGARTGFDIIGDSYSINFKLLYAFDMWDLL